MKNLYKAISILIILLLPIGCQEDDTRFGEVVTPSNLTVTVNVAEDQSGNVVVTPTAQGATLYHVYFTPDTDPVVITDGEQANFRYTQSGMYSQAITIIAFGTGGASSSTTVTVDLDIILVIDPQKLSDIAGAAGEGKRWVWDATNAGHFGVGDPEVNFPNFFSASPNQLNPCLYDDVLTFQHDGQGNYNYALETTEATFTNWAEVKRFFPEASPIQFEDECRDLGDQIDVSTDFVILDNPTGNPTLTVTNSTLSYWSGATTYEIIELTENILVVRGIQEPFDPPGDPLAWYHTFVPDGGVVEPTCSGLTGNTGSGNNDVLVWSDEFNDDGAPCIDNWQYDIGTGDNGWGNAESQYYTDRPENIIVENGVLKITAKAEVFNGSPYTSSRINSKDKFEFQYGRIEFRAKLPTGGGTWPAIWSLGADIDTNPWPGAGEIDYMEHVGNQQDRIFSTVHFPGNSGGNAIGDSIIVPGVSDDFHVYEVIWDENEIRSFIDNTLYFTFPNNSNVPFNKDFFMVMNVAMGGNFGGAIDPNFTESSMEVDYIRVYQ